MKRGDYLRRTKRVRRRRMVGAREITDKVLDAACRAVVFARDGYRCLVCGGTSYLQWAHVYSRRYKSIRWDPQNSMALCAKHHLEWHHQPVASAMWWRERVGETVDMRLRQRLKIPAKIDRKLQLLYLQQELKKYG